jgi:hypothetical protein
MNTLLLNLRNLFQWSEIRGIRDDGLNTLLLKYSKANIYIKNQNNTLMVTIKEAIRYQLPILPVNIYTYFKWIVWASQASSSALANGTSTYCYTLIRSFYPHLVRSNLTFEVVCLEKEKVPML